MRKSSLQHLWKILFFNYSEIPSSAILRSDIRNILIRQTLKFLCTLISASTNTAFGFVHWHGLEVAKKLLVGKFLKIFKWNSSNPRNCDHSNSLGVMSHPKRPPGYASCVRALAPCIFFWPAPGPRTYFLVRAGASTSNFYFCKSDSAKALPCAHIFYSNTYVIVHSFFNYILPPPQMFIKLIQHPKFDS